jgi:hypothetical protein
MTNFSHSYARYTNPERYRMAKISHHFRFALAPKEFTKYKQVKMFLIFNGFKLASENFEGRALRNCPVGNFSEGA